MAWIYLIYYLVPGNIGGYSKRVLFLVVVLVILSFELLRIWQGWQVFGLRDYERTKMAAYAWATLGAAIALLLFPKHLVILVLVGMGAIDPLCGEIRHHFPRLYPLIPLAAYFLLSAFILSSLTDHVLSAIVILSLTGSAAAITAEYPNILLDDDFLMILVPLVVLWTVEYLLI
ncbi:MAG: hypothetical protein R6U17_01605 [Thermoplasmata archaeon]